MRRVALALMLLSAALAAQAAPASNVSAVGCGQWMISGTWSTVQSNNYHGVFVFTQVGTDVRAVGSVSLAEMRAAGMTSPTWEVSGTLKGDQLVLRGVQPPRTNGVVITGEYRATISDGALNGTAEDVTDHVKVTWTGTGKTTCVGAIANVAAGPGSSAPSDSVRRLQRDLQRLGIYSGPLDGRNDDRTKAAVKKFQYEVGITVDGKCDTRCEAALKKALALFDPAVPAGSAPSSPSSVTQLQADLKSLGFYSGPLDGRNDDRTQAAVKKFQHDVGIAVDGECTARCQHELVKALTRT